MGIVSERTHTDWLDIRSYPFEPKYLSVEGGQMHYVDTEGGRPIVFVHGWPTWSYEFRTVIRLLSKEFRCIAPDLIGFGLSSKPEDWSYSTAAQGRNLSKLLTHLDLHQAILVAVDYGGPVALSAAFENLPRLAGLVLMNTWMWDLASDPPALKQAHVAESAIGRVAYLSMNTGPKLIKGMFCDKSKYSESVHEAYMHPFDQKSDRHGVLKTAIEVDKGGAWFSELWAMRDQLADMPIQLIWGTDCSIHGASSLNKIWHEFPMAEVREIGDAGRMLTEEHPEMVAESIRSFALRHFSPA